MEDPVNQRRFPMQFALCYGQRPLEELYDVRADPDQMNNLAAAPAHAATRERLGRALLDYREPQPGKDGTIDLAQLARGTMPPYSNHFSMQTGGAALVRDLCDYACALMTSQLAGCARRDMELAAEYARQREAFGQPIGSFQAIQHLMADMLIAVDGVELLVHEALWRLDRGLPASIEVSQAKAFAGDKCIFVGRSAQQIHGGMGFMMECDLQLWYRRIVAFSLRCGSVREHRGCIAAALIDQPGKVRLGVSRSFSTQ